MDMFTELLARSERAVLEIEMAGAERAARVAAASPTGLRQRSTSWTTRWRRRVLLVAIAMIASCADGGGEAVDRPAASTRGSTPVTEQASTTAGPPPPTTMPPTTTSTAPSRSMTTSAVTTPPVDWRAEVTAMCDRLGAAIGAIHDPDVTPAEMADYVEAHRGARDSIPPFDVATLPPEVRGGPHGIAAETVAQEAALTAAERAARSGDAEAARAALDTYYFHLLKTGNVFAVGGARCGGAEPARAAGAALNVPVAFSPLNATAGFGSIWVTEHDGSRVFRVDADSGEVLAAVDVGDEPVKLQPADGRMWGRTTDAVFAIDTTANTVTATLPKADVGPAADRAWAVDGGLWICDGQRIHRYDPTTVEPIAVIELGIACDMPGGTKDLIVASTYNDDDGQSGAAAAAFIDPATNKVLATVALPVDVTIGIVLDDSVFFAGEHGSQAVVVDRSTWKVRDTPDLQRDTGHVGTVEADATSVYVPTLDERDVLVVDISTFAVTDTIETLGVHSVTVEEGSLWTAYYDGFLQRFDRD
jgi:hypothetical protein